MTTFLFAAAGLMMLCPTEAQAGPRPGLYKGDLTRTCQTAEPTTKTSAATSVRASNPTDSRATFSTNVVVDRSFGPNDRLNFTLKVLPDGRVNISGEGIIIRRQGSKLPYPFTFSATGAGTFTNTSFKTTSAMGTVGGKSARISAEAISIGKKLSVTLTIDPNLSTHPLGQVYTARFTGNRP